MLFAMLYLGYYNSTLQRKRLSGELNLVELGWVEGVEGFESSQRSITCNGTTVFYHHSLALLGIYFIIRLYGKTTVN